MTLSVSSNRLGIRKEDLPKYEEQLELKIAKAQLGELKKEALEAMETQKKRYLSRTFLSTFLPPYLVCFFLMHSACSWIQY